MKTYSLRLRLGGLLLLLTLLTWGIASVFAWMQTTKSINELFDTQQMAFAKRLSVLPSGLAFPSSAIQKTKKMLSGNRGKQDDDALAFAIFTPQGERVLDDGENGRKIPFSDRKNGFRDGTLTDDNDQWRFVQLPSSDGRYIIVVGQEWEYREDMGLTIITAQAVPWLVVLPLMLLLFLWLLTRALTPLRLLARQLQRRSPAELTPLTPPVLPKEVSPMLDALNGLFLRIRDLRERESRFTSDAAHELRSPLAALKVQSEVMQIAGDDPATREHVTANLITGIDRATRLVDQLLTLSRLESQSHPAENTEQRWSVIISDAVAQTAAEAAEHQVSVITDLSSPELSVRGEQLLLTVMLRNLLHNAVRYGKTGGTVQLILTAKQLVIEDDGPGVSDETLARLGERFYRPPGQEKTGSGLGLSIVKRIAELHHMTIQFRRSPQGGFIAEIRW
ncbi:quorum sensing histidine kinase QseC [Morganella morganii]|uniref:quorum sensing histidine kinase QseC n=1 Tax=Morganella morganii TaxID=582 RepID=UPI001E3BB7B5|nr:quorum sensing histidine kinase QseC [Morganella morganii]UFH70435.1 two-component system sensor histidine kinase QseC [Morganella morganii]